MDLKSMGKILEEPASIKLICLILLIFLATIGLWIRPNLFGVDSYATLAFIRFGWADTLINQPVANFFFDLLPDSIVLFKLLMFLSIVAAIVPLWLLVKKFNGERSAWIATFLILGLSPIVLFSFGEFENEIFAFPLIVWGIYFLMLKRHWAALSCFAGSLLFWKWVYYLTFFNNGAAEVVEMQMFAGLINLWLLLPFIFFVHKIKSSQGILLATLSLIFVLINAKLLIFALPFVALAIPHGLKTLEKFPTIRFSVFIIAFIGLFGWNIAFFMQQPTQIDNNFVSEAIQLSRDTNLPLFNDHSFGYWIQAQGHKTPFNPGSWKEFDANIPGIYLTAKDLNCLVIKKEKVIGRKQVAIFQCN